MKKPVILTLTILSNFLALNGFCQSTPNILTADDLKLEKTICTKPITSQLIGDLEKKVESNDKSWQNHFVLLVLYSKLKLTSSAAKELDTLTKIIPNDSSIYLYLIDNLVKNDQIDVASELLQKAAVLFPENFSNDKLSDTKAIKNSRSLKGVSLALAQASFNKKQYYKAMQLSRLANTGEDYYAYFQEGLSLMNLCQYQQAEIPLQKAYLHLRNVNTSQMYSKCLLWLGKYKMLLEPALFGLAHDKTIMTKPYSDMLDYIIPKIPNNFTKNTIEQFIANNKIENILFYSVLAKVTDKYGLYDISLTLYNNLTKVDPQNYDAWFNLASLYEKDKRDYQMALKYYNKAYELKPYSKAYDCIIRIQERLNDKPNDLAWYIKDFIFHTF